jgi:hypothetical protein
MIARLLLAAAVALMVIGTAGAQTKGPNGGTVVKADDHPIEFVLRGQEIVFYIGDHDGKPLATKGIQARAVIQDKGRTTTVTLTPAEPNMFVGKVAAPIGSKARVVFSSKFHDHALQARFVTD